jgi:hypothetical protein
LKMWTSFMPEGDVVSLDASGGVLSTLAALDDQGTTLKTATVQHPDGTTSPLIDPKYADDDELMAHVSQAVQNTMALASQHPAATAGAGRRWRPPNDPLVARYLPRGEDRFDGRPPDRHFEVDFSGDKPVIFRQLTPQEAEDRIATYAAAEFHLRFLGVDWGDVFDVIKSKVARAPTCWCSPA